ncbi:hypothetical protein OH492_14440 [Vibrio chagasii]|nr:hypothetical protein [Vibrio chagasii]
MRRNKKELPAKQRPWQLLIAASWNPSPEQSSTNNHAHRGLSDGLCVVLFSTTINQCVQQGLGVYYYIPKLESMEEAQWWDDIFSFTEHYSTCSKRHHPCGDQVLITETLPAVSFQMEDLVRHAPIKHRWR